MVQKRAVLGVAIHDDAAEKNGLIEELRGRIAQLEQTTIAGNLNSNGRGAKAAAKKERDTLLKLFFAAATSGLGCRPHTDLSGSVKNICEAVSEVGLKIDAGTVRKYVREAAELIDPADLKPLGAKRR